MKRSRSLQHGALSLFIKRHKSAALISLGRLKKNTSTTIFTSLVIAITLALPMLLMVLVKNIDVVGAGITNSAKISVYLKTDVSEQQIKHLISELSAQDSIANIHYISPAEGLSEFAKSVGFENVLSGLKRNPLPAVLEVTPSIAYQSPEKLSILTEKLRQFSMVQEVQLDMAWVKRLFAIIALLKEATLGISIILGLGIVIIVGNTIKYAIQNYHKEIQVLKLIGASDGLIRRPFLYTGLFYGLFGTLLAMLIVSIFMLSLTGVINHVAAVFSTTFQIQLFGLSGFVGLTLVGIFLGLLGAWTIVGRSLKVL